MTSFGLTVIFSSALLSISTVDRIDDRPIAVVNIKCPTELVDIQTPSTKAFHFVVTQSIGVVNQTNIFKYEIIQVCK